MERTYNEQVHDKNVNLYEEWSRVYKWYRRYKESERRRQQDALHERSDCMGRLQQRNQMVIDRFEVVDRWKNRR